MSTPARKPIGDTTPDDARREALARLAEQLDEALAGVEIARTEVGEAERHGRRVVVPVAVEVAEENDAPAEKSWSEEDPEGFEEAVEYILEKNRELLQRLA